LSTGGADVVAGCGERLAATFAQILIQLDFHAADSKGTLT
jgi:hypothetical protein